MFEEPNLNPLFGMAESEAVHGLYERPEPMSILQSNASDSTEKPKSSTLKAAVG